jgi:phenylacetate-coenzyme A ligase PaaK-like adenylate-forming protein
MLLDAQERPESGDAMTDSSFDRFRARFQQRLFAGLADHVQRLTWNSEQIAARQRAGLRSLIAHAVARSPFHARRLAHVDPSTFELDDLTRLPIMTKAEMMAEFDDVLTDRRLSRQTVEEVIANTAEEPIALLGEYLCQASGGSSGQRGVFVLDCEAMVEFASSLLRSSIARGGGLPPGGMTIGFVAAASAVHATGIASQILRGSPMRFIPAPATLPIDEIADRLETIQPGVVYGYPSILARLAADRRSGRLRIAPASVVSTSETLLPEQRAAIVAGFGVPVVDTYGSSEGLVGVSDPDETPLKFATDLCIVELVDEQNRPVPDGVRSAKVLVTNLFNSVQPLIRYVLEDSFVREPQPRDDGHLRATVEGRSDDILCYGTASIHPLAIRAVMVKTPAVTEYQVRQTPRGIDVTVVAEGELDQARLAERLRVALAEAGLADPVIGVDAVQSLERQPGTGKLRRFVPLAKAAAGRGMDPGTMHP